MLGYRLFLEVTDDRDGVERVVREQVHSWLRGKRLDADSLAESRLVPLGPGTEGLVLTREERDGSRRVRIRTIERRSARETWDTQVTLEVPGRALERPWVMIEVEGPKPADPPRLARQMLGVLQGRHGSVTFGAEPAVVGTDGVDDLLSTILDPNRRTVLFVAGSDEGIDLGVWREHISKLLARTVGVAAGFVLDPEATTALAARLGPRHGVDPWTMRTFRPGVLIDQPLDARRHRVLSMKRITDDPDRRIAALLGRVASEVSREAPVPPRARRVDRLLQNDMNELVVGLLADPVAPSPLANTVKAAPLEPSPLEAVPRPLPRPTDPLIAETPTPDEAEVESATGVRLTSELADAARQLVGAVDDEQVLVLRLLTLAQQGRRAQESQHQIKRRLDAYELQVQELEQTKRRLQTELDDSELDHAAAQGELAEAERRVRYYRSELFRVGAAAEATTEPESEVRPESYVDLVEFMTTFEYLRFTGDEDIVLQLAEQDRAEAWPGKIWDIACTLDDYARAIAENTFDGDVDAYLKEPPAGCRTYSANRHARDETGSLRSNQKYAEKRCFPVPLDVDPDGVVFMGAHFKVAQARQTSPRLHYHNDVRGTGMIYIGYIGPHLRSAKTT